MPLRGPNLLTPAIEHGTRRTYRVSRCRCLPCRAANAEYERHRTTACIFPDPAELVDSIFAELHLTALRAQGVGYRQVAKLAGLTPQLVKDIRGGRVPMIRADTSARCLGVKAILAHGQRVTGWRSWRLIDSLEREGYTRSAIAAKLGQRSGSLQLSRRRISVKNALRVRAVYHHVNAEGPDLPLSKERP